jgi:transcriptional antiterminator RfaH
LQISFRLRDKSFMDLWQETNWYAVHAKAHRESFAAANVATVGVEVLLPKVKQETSVQGVSRTLIKPLFAGYFFARFCPVTSLDLIRYAQSVLQVVSTGQFPIPVAEDIIASIQERILADGYVLLAASSVKRGDWVEIEQGPFQGFMGKVEQEEHDRGRVTILLEAMMNARVSVEKRWLSATRAAA